MILQSLIQDSIDIEKHYTSVKYVYQKDIFTEPSFDSNQNDYLLTVAITTDSYVL